LNLEPDIDKMCKGAKVQGIALLDSCPLAPLPPCPLGHILTVWILPPRKYVRS
jgi:hypothetical protein